MGHDDRDPKQDPPPPKPPAEVRPDLLGTEKKDRDPSDLEKRDGS